LTDATGPLIFLGKYGGRVRNSVSSVGAIKIQAGPDQMQFSPKELYVEPGASVRLIFENPDLMFHNLLVVRPGSIEEVGQLADKLAAQPDGMAKNYVPVSNKSCSPRPS